MKKLLIMISFIILSCNTMLLAQLEWGQLSGPYGGLIQKIKSTPNNEVVVVAGSNGYRTKDLGMNWDLIPNLGFSPLDFFFFADKAFAISIADEQNHNKIYVSTDNLKTWTESNTGLGSRFICNLKNINGNYYACTDSGVYKSTNFGLNWKLEYHIKALPMFYYVNDINLNSENTIFASTGYGLYRSKNGVDWELMNPTNEDMVSNIENIIITKDDRIILNTPMGLFKSTDKGDSWKQIADGIINTNLSFLINPENDIIIAGKTWNGGIMYSDNFGTSWSSVYNKGLLCILELPDKKYMAGGFDGVIYSDEINGEWEARNFGINELEITSIFIDKNTNYIMVGSENGDIFKSDDDGNTWKTLYNLNDSKINKIIKTSDGTLFAVAMWGGIARSKDNGQSWELANNGLDDWDVNDILEDNKGNLFAGTFSVLYKSTDKGDSWKINLSQNESMQIKKVISTSNDNIFIASSVYGILKSTNNGKNWVQTINGLTKSPKYLESNSADKLFAVSGQGDLFVSENLGENWTLAKEKTGILCMFFPNESSIIAGIDKNHEVVGLYCSYDNGINWNPEYNGMGIQYVYALNQNSDKFLYAGTSKGIFKTKTALSVEGNNSDEILFLYPNPVKEYLYIKYEQNEHIISIFISDANGKIVKAIKPESNLSEMQKIFIGDLNNGFYNVIINKKNSAVSNKIIICK